MSTSLAGVQPPTIASTAARGTLMSTIIRAMSSEGVPIARSATARSIACRAMNISTRSKSSLATPSISTIAPSRIERLGTGSNGLCVVLRPTSGQGLTNVSLLIGRLGDSLEAFGAHA